MQQFFIWNSHEYFYIANTMESHFGSINNLRSNVRTIFIKIIQQSCAIECAIKKRYAIYYCA